MSQMWNARSFALHVYLLLSLLFPKILLASDGFSWRANTKFQVLMENSAAIASNNANVFWQFANAFRAMAFYCSVAKINCENVGHLAKKIYAAKTNNGQDWWKDDYGWTGLFFIKVYELSTDFIERQNLLELAQLSFENMLMAKNYYKIAPPDLQTEQPPLFIDGCYNTNLVAISQNDNLTGIQNTVTNLLFFNLSLELFQIFYKNRADQKSAEKAKYYWNFLVAQYNWFKNWFDKGLFNNSYGLIEERVSTYKNLQPALGYQKDRFWLGDQGLFLLGWSNLLDQVHLLLWDNPLKLNIMPFDRQKIAAIFTSTANAIPRYLVDQKKILLPIYLKNGDQFPFGDQSDYATGPGNFMVNVFASKNSEETKAWIESYREIIRANANVAASHSDMDPQSVDDYNLLATDLALLSAAMLAGM